MATQAQKPEDTAQIQQTASDPAAVSEKPDTFTILRPARASLSPEETRARMEAFAAERKEAFIAAIREDEG